MLGLERLVVGRECNAFDRLSAERKARAYAELVEAGFAHGDVGAKEGQAHPEVFIRRVSSAGKRALRAYRPLSGGVRSQKSGGSSGGASWKIALFFVVFAAVLLLALMVISHLRG